MRRALGAVTARWIMDGRARASKKYQETHARLCAEVMRDRRRIKNRGRRAHRKKPTPKTPDLFEAMA